MAAFKAGVLTYRQVAHWIEFHTSLDCADALRELAPHLPAELRAEVLTDALRAARAIDDTANRARALRELAPHLPAELLPEVLTVARAIDDTAHRAYALGGLAPHLPAELLPEALTIAQALDDPAHRARALGWLAPQLSGDLLQRGFDELLHVLPRCKRPLSLHAVSSFFPFLEEFQGPKGLEEVRRAVIDTARWFP